MSEEFSEAVDFQAIMDGDTCESILKLDILDDSLAQLDGDSDSNFTALILLPCNVALALSCQIRQGHAMEVYDINAYPGDRYEELVRYEKLSYMAKKMALLIRQTDKGSTPIKLADIQAAFKISVDNSPKFAAERDAEQIRDCATGEPAVNFSSKIHRSF